MANETWVLVADASRARIFVDRGRRTGLEPVLELSCPASREHVKDRVSDRSGLKPGGGAGARSGVVPILDPKEAEAKAFARQLAELLKKKQNDQAYKDLVLAAPPHFLGLLRNSLDETVAKRVVTAIDKDFTSLDSQELARRIKVPVL
jgi:protein required for attachment to host cells